MQLGWIDFSKKERDKVLDVLDSLKEQGTLDELGIAPIRDGFSDLFFPGTSTLQTRAKYFLLIPYACKDLENNGDISNPKTANKKLHEIEHEICKILHESNPNELGIVGADSLNNDDWVKRPPSILYWAGLRRYNIFNRSISLSEYLKAICAIKKDKDILKKLGNRKDTEDCDDKDAGAVQSIRFFSIPTYRIDWKDNLTIKLTKSEATYLKNQILNSEPNSLFAYLLNFKDKTFLNCNSFEKLKDFINVETIKNDFKMAVDFSKFSYVLRTVYNIVVSKGKNECANIEMENLIKDLKQISSIDICNIFIRLKVNNDKLKLFLLNSRKAMEEGNLEELKNLVTNREISIKGSNRAKTKNPNEAYADKWIGGKYLDYRFQHAKQIIEDIFEAEADNV